MKVACLLILLFLIGATLPTPTIRSVRAYAITVPDDYPTIQEAIDHAVGGGTVFVRNGTYHENVMINKSVSLIGESWNSTIIDGDGNGTVITVLSDHVMITGLTIQNGGSDWPASSIWLTNSHNSIITNCLVKNNHWYGIGLNYSDSISIVGNILSENYKGLWTVYSNNCTVRANIAFGNLEGIWLQYSMYCLVTGNVAYNNTIGIVLYKSNTNSVCNNTMLANWVGLALEEEGDGDYIIENSVYGNTIRSNTMGIRLSAAQNNVIFHNNLLNNMQQVYHYAIFYSDNAWDNGCEGNFWSNYNGTDLDGDGIGNTPYILNTINQDNYPLMNLYWNPADIDHDLDVDIFDVVRCAGAYGSTPSSLNWNPHCDIAEPYGIINILDIVTIAGSYGKEYVP